MPSNVLKMTGKCVLIIGASFQQHWGPINTNRLNCPDEQYKWALLLWPTRPSSLCRSGDRSIFGVLQGPFCLGIPLRPSHRGRSCLMWFRSEIWGEQDIMVTMATIIGTTILVNPSPPSAAYMRHWNGSALVQVLACRLFGAKPLPEPMLVYCQLDSWEQISVKLGTGFYHFHSRKCIWNCRLQKYGPFCPGVD